MYISNYRRLLVPNPGINPGIPGLAFLNPEIPGLENGPGIAIPNCIALICMAQLCGTSTLSQLSVVCSHAITNARKFSLDTESIIHDD